MDQTGILTRISDLLGESATTTPFDYFLNLNFSIRLFNLNVLPKHVIVNRDLSI